MIKRTKANNRAFEGFSNEFVQSNRNRIESFSLEDHDDMETHQKSRVISRKSHFVYASKEAYQTEKEIAKSNPAVVFFIDRTFTLYFLDPTIDWKRYP